MHFFDRSAVPASQRFWGPATATLNWCETDYAVTRFIAEFYNTLSNAAFVAVAVFGFRCLPLDEWRFVICLWLLVAVGAGSALFHATLTRTMQLLDELPMVYAAAALLWALLERHVDATTSHARTTFTQRRRRTYGPWLEASFVSASVAFSAMYAFVWRSAAAQQALFAAVMAWVTTLCARCAAQTKSVDARRMCFASTALFIVGFFAWNVDNLFCEYVEHLYLHAVWHLCTAAGSWFCLCFVVYDRLRRRGRHPTVERWCSVLPYVSVSTLDQQWKRLPSSRPLQASASSRSSRSWSIMPFSSSTGECEWRGAAAATPRRPASPTGARAATTPTATSAFTPAPKPSQPASRMPRVHSRVEFFTL